MWRRYFFVVMLLIFCSGCVSRPRAPIETNQRAPDYFSDKDNNICLSCISSSIKWEKGFLVSMAVRGHNVRVLLGSPWVKIDNFHIKLPQEVRFVNNKIYADRSVLSYINNLSLIANMKKATVMIDPGHGGKDPGAIGNGIFEKDIVLDIAKRVCRMLKEAGIKVYMTRDMDKYLSLKGRCNLANKILPDVFISIHANASRNRKAKGIEVYYVSEKIDDTNRAVVSKENSALQFENNSEADPELKTILWDLIHTENRAESLRLAKTIAHNISIIMHSPNRGAKGGPFYVLKWVNVPSVLIEVGFLSNPTEAEKLANPSYREKIASAIFNGLLSYFEQLKRCDSEVRR